MTGITVWSLVFHSVLLLGSRKEENSDCPGGADSLGAEGNQKLFAFAAQIRQKLVESLIRRAIIGPEVSSKGNR